MDKSDKPHLRFLKYKQETDFRSTFGRNIRYICDEAGVDTIFEIDLSNIVYAEVPEQQRYRIFLIQEALEMRQNKSETFLSEEEIDFIINTLSID